MGWTFINGLLAFAITMIVLSTVMAAIVEFLFELRRKRKHYMRAYLLDFFDTQILPDFHRKIVETITSKAAQAQSEGTERILANGDEKLLEKMKTLVGVIFRYVWNLGSRSKLWSTAFFLLLFGAMIILAAFLNDLLIPAIILLVLWYFFDRYAIETALDRGIDEPTIKALQIDDDDVARLESFRQKFAKDIAKLGKDDSNRNDYATRLTATEFAAALGRSELADILVDTGRDKLDLLITDILRRFDDTGAQSREEFKRQATRLSVIAAFVTAFALNINAVSLLDTYFADDELSNRIIALYSEEELAALASTSTANLETRLEKLSEIEEDIEAAEENDQTPEESLEGLKRQAADLRDEIDQIVSGLTDAGTPIGWRHYPFCLKGDTDRQYEVAPGCEGLRQYAELFKQYAKRPCEDRENTASAGENANGSAPQPGTTAASGTTEAEASQEETVATCQVVREKIELSVIEEIQVHATAAEQWVSERQKGLLFWVVGVLLAGVLIGLGGPFWFDFYRRLAMLSQISRSLGLSAQPQTTTATVEAGTSGVESAETQHAPPSAPKAFKDAVEAREITRDKPIPRRLLNADGT